MSAKVAVVISPADIRLGTYFSVSPPDNSVAPSPSDKNAACVAVRPGSPSCFDAALAVDAEATTSVYLKLFLYMKLPMWYITSRRFTSLFASFTILVVLPFLLFILSPKSAYCISELSS